MNNELLTVLDYLENERGINRDTLIGLVEESLLSAARKAVGPANELRVKINRDTGDIQAWAQLTVVTKVTDTNAEIAVKDARVKAPAAKAGDAIEWEVTPENFGRIAAQTAKQTIMQRLRQAEKELVCEEFKERLLDLVSGVVVRVERGEIFVDLTRAEGVMPYKERIPGEEYQPGDHFTGILVAINTENPGPSLILSRAHPSLVMRLFEREVSEIGEHLVEIKAVAREPGYRSKIAVTSADSGIDPVGACVGLRGSRVKTIVRELAGEKVDIIRWDADIATFVTNALQPAKLARVKLDKENHVVHIEAPDDQLSLAIGKKGQNARLAAKLTGWRIDIQKLVTAEETQFESKIKNAIAELQEKIPELGKDAAKLVAHGFLSIDGILAAEPEDLTEVEGIDEARARVIIEAARKQTEQE